MHITTFEKIKPLQQERNYMQRAIKLVQKSRDDLTKPIWLCTLNIDTSGSIQNIIVPSTHELCDLILKSLNDRLAVIEGKMLDLGVVLE